jgi:hypothetical protein
MLGTAAVERQVAQLGASPAHPPPPPAATACPAAACRSTLVVCVAVYLMSAIFGLDNFGAVCLAPHPVVMQLQGAPAAAGLVMGLRRRPPWMCGAGNAGSKKATLPLSPFV